MGHIAHLRNQFQSKSTFAINDEKEIKTLKYENWMVLIWKKTNLNSHEQRLFWSNFAQRFWKKGPFNSVNRFSLFCLYLTMEKCGILHLKNKMNPLDPRMLLLSLVKIGSRILKEKVLFLISSIRFRYSVVLELPLEKDWVLHLYLNSLHLHPRMPWAWFG